MTLALPEQLSVMVRGWLHGNVVILKGDEPAIFDTGYWTGVPAIVESFERHVGRPIDSLANIYLTHVHSDHSGGCAELVERSGATVHAHEKCRQLTDPWDDEGLWMVGMSQRLPRFGVDRALSPGDEFEAGGLTWSVIELAGHATGGVGFHDAEHGLLVGGDALWERGLGMLQPWIDGPQVFDEAEAALDRIMALDPEVVIPGHGRPILDVAPAVSRARDLISLWRREPARMYATGKLSAISFWLLAHEGCSRRELEEAVIAFLATRHDAVSSQVPIEGASMVELVFSRGIAVEREGAIFAGEGIRAV